MKVKGFLKDVGGASRVTKLRRETIQKASSIPDPKDPIRALADAGILMNGQVVLCRGIPL